MWGLVSCTLACLVFCPLPSVYMPAYLLRQAIAFLGLFEVSRSVYVLWQTLHLLPIPPHPCWYCSWWFRFRLSVRDLLLENVIKTQRDCWVLKETGPNKAVVQNRKNEPSCLTECHINADTLAAQVSLWGPFWCNTFSTLIVLFHNVSDINHVLSWLYITMRW